MKILFVVSSYSHDGAGAGTSVRNLAEGVLQLGHQSVVVCLAKKDAQIVEELNGVRIYRLPIRNVYPLTGAQKGFIKRFFWHLIDMFNPWAARDFYKILKSEKPDVVNTSVIAGFSASILCVPRMLGIPLVHTMRDYYLMCPQNAMFRDGKNCETVCVSCKPFKEVRKLCGNRVDLYLANSAFVGDRHKKFNALPAGKRCETQFNMNNDDYIGPPRPFPAGKTVVFGFIGRVTDTKGVEILLEAARHLSFEKWEIHIGGAGHKFYIEQLKEKFPDPRIVFKGHVDADEFYRSVDILVCPSLYEEPLPRVVYEAYRFAVPVIVARTGGTPEIVEENVCGFIYEARDARALAGHMNALATDASAYEKLSKGAAEKARNFTASAISESFLLKLNSVIKSHV